MIQSLDKSQTEHLLDRLNGWRSGICPDGKLARVPSFVLGQMPNIVIHPDTQHLFTTEIITEYEWAENLLHCGCITNLDDGIMMKALADFYLLFHEKTDKTSRTNTVHLIQLRKHASFKVDHIFRPTRSLQLELDGLYKKTELLEQWNHLLKIWSVFGYLWPRRIVLGYKTHVKETYSFKDDVEGMHAYYHHSGTVKRKLQSAQELATFDLDQFLTEGVIVSRLDLAPLHDFLDPVMKQRIDQIIHSMFVRIPVNCPIKFYNVLTRSYLCWDPLKKSQPDTIFKGQNLDYIVRSISADPADLNQSPESQYLWNIMFYPVSENDDEQMGRQLGTVRGGDKVYIYPACKTQLPAHHKSTPSQTHHWPIHDRVMDAEDYADTDKMVLSCCPHRYESEPPSLSKLKGLRLLSSQSPYYADEMLDWRLEHPNSRLKYMSDAAMNLKLNIHEYLRRTRPVLEGSTIHLQQIGLLTAFAYDAASSPPSSFESEDPSVQSLRTTKKITQQGKAKFHKNNVLCVDEDITFKRFAYNTLWKIERATRFDMDRHSSNFPRGPQSDKKLAYLIERHPTLQDVGEHYSTTFSNTETGSLMSTTSYPTLQRSKSLGSLPDKAQYYEDLVNTKGTSKMISHFVKRVSLQPLTQLVKPTTRNNKSQQLSPPPFSRRQTED